MSFSERPAISLRAAGAVLKWTWEKFSPERSKAKAIGIPFQIITNNASGDAPLGPLTALG